MQCTWLAKNSWTGLEGREARLSSLLLDFNQSAATNCITGSCATTCFGESKIFKWAKISMSFYIPKNLDLQNWDKKLNINKGVLSDESYLFAVL